MSRYFGLCERFPRFLKLNCRSSCQSYHRQTLVMWSKLHARCLEYFDPHDDVFLYQILFAFLMPIQEPRTSSTTVCRRNAVLQSTSCSQSGILQAGSSKFRKARIPKLLPIAKICGICLWSSGWANRNGSCFRRFMCPPYILMAFDCVAFILKLLHFLPSNPVNSKYQLRLLAIC